MIHLPGTDGGEVTIHPNVIHDVLDRLPVGEWQVVQGADAIQLVVARPGEAFDGGDVAESFARALRAAGALPPPVTWFRVDSIPRSGSGKAPLIRALRTPGDAGERPNVALPATPM